MLLDESEENLLRSVALQNARAVTLARKRAEQESVASKQRVINILESITDGFLALDKEWKFTYVNRRGDELLKPLNRSGESLIGKSLWELSSGMGSEVEAQLKRAVREEVSVGFETFSDILEQWFEVRAYPGIDGLSVYFHDITGRKKEELSRSRLVAVVEFSDDAIISMRLDTIITSWNKGAERMFGYSAAEVVGNSVTLLIPAGFQDEEPKILNRLLGGERIEHYETIRCRKDGTQIMVSLTVSPIYDLAGKIVGVSKISRDITARKQAEEALAQTNERLTSVLNSITDAFMSLDREWRVTYLNPSAAAILKRLGQEPLVAVGKTHWELLPAMSGTIVENEYRRAIRENVSVAFETYYAPTRNWFDISAYPSPGGLSLFLHDITDRKNSQDALLRSEGELRAMANSIPHLAWMAQPDGHVFWYNQRWFEYTGMTFSEMEGWGWQSVHDPRILDKVLERWKTSLSTGTPFEMEYPLRGADRHFRWFLTRVNPLRDHEGRVVRWFGTNTDVDQLRKAQQALDEERRVLELLNNTGKTIAAQLDLQKVVQTVTDSATELTEAQFGAFFYNVVNNEGESFLLYTLSGAPREAFETFGQPRATALFGPTFRGDAPIRVADVKKDPRYGQMAPHHGMPKGHLPVTSYLAVPVISRSGEVIGGLFFGHPEPDVFTERAEQLVVGMAAQAAVAIDNARLFDGAQRELAERIKVEEALRDAQAELRGHAETLEREVADRTVRLRETVQELEAFSYSVSHDMRSPLRAMQGYADFLLEEYSDKLDEPGVEYLRRIRRSSRRMDLLIQDVLAYSKVAKGDIDLHPVNVEDVVRDVIQNYPSLQPEKAEITILPLPPVVGHEAYVTQIVSNFLGNAVKFVAPEKKPSIIVRGTEEGEMVRISIEDNGLGIAPKHQKQIFQIFGRVYSEKKFEGTGIGLAIAKKAAERMGGSVGLESELGVGSKFFFLLRSTI